MKCLYDYIGIKGFGEEPVSGIFINQLPGLPLESIDRIAETEKQGFEGLWNDIKVRAGIRLEKDLRRMLRTRYKLTATKSTAEVKPDIDTDNVHDAEEKYKGIVIDLGCGHGSFVAIGIDSFSVTLSEDAAEVTIKFFDEDGNELDSFTKANATEGKNTINVARKYAVRKLFVAIDATAIPLYAASIPVTTLHSCYQCICEVYSDCKPVIHGAESEIDTPADLTKTDDVFGLEIKYNVLCDYNSIVCFNKQEFTDVWMYLLGNELMIERCFSTRMNRYTTIDRENATQLKDYYSVEYEKALKESIDALHVREEDCCIECNPAVGTIESLP